jgi:hypothetical protein
MFKALRQKNAQSVMSEYLLVFFLAVGMISAMTVYFRRAIQGRVHDARDYVWKDIYNRMGGNYYGNLYKEYEPYYLNSQSIISRISYSNETLLEGKATGIYRKSIDDYTSVSTNSTTAAPGAAK